MNGPEHYREAERLVSVAHDLADLGDQVRADFILARAQINATLALTAAMQPGAMDADKQRAWREVTA